MGKQTLTGYSHTSALLRLGNMKRQVA